MRTLDMADKYPPADSDFDQDNDPTVKVHMPNFLPKVIIARECECGDEDCDVCKTDLYGKRDTVPMPSSYPASHFQQETRYPGVGLILIVATAACFWGAIAWFFLH